MTTRAESHSTEHGQVTHVDVSGNRATSVLDHARHPELADLAAANADFAARVTAAFERFQPNAAREDVLANAAPALLRAQGRAMLAGSASRRAFMEADARLHELPASIDMRQEQERRARVAAMDMDRQYAAVKSADLPDLAAWVARGNLAGIADHAFALAEERYLALNWAERAALASDHPQRPTLSNLTPAGPDMVAVEAAAQDLIAQHKQRGAEVDSVENALRSNLNMIATALEMTPAETLEAVLAAS